MHTTAEHTTRTDQTSIWLKRSAQFTLAAILLGQISFILYILLFYVRFSLTGQFDRLNDKPHLSGFEAADPIGSGIFLLHVLGGGLVIGLGLLQLISGFRRRPLKLHRWAGRAYAAIAVLSALNGLWLTWMRGSYISIPSALAVSGNAIAILICVGFTVRYAWKKQFRVHQEWALRAFLVVSGVWFFRVMIMAFNLIGKSVFSFPSHLMPLAMDVMNYASYLLPLAIFELYRQADRRKRPALNMAASLPLNTATLLLAVGIFGTISFMWMPYL